MQKKKLLIIGISKDIHTTKRILSEIKEKELEYVFVKWGSFVFFEENIFFEDEKIKLSDFSGIFCDIPCYKLYLSKNDKEKSVYFKLYNELHEICRQAVELNIPIINGKFILENPFYNKFTQAQIFSNKVIKAIPTLHLSDNKLSKVKKALDIFDIKYPLVIKQSEGGMGRSVWLASDEKKMEEIISDKRNLSLIYQPFIKNDCDFRVLVVGGKVLGIMKRVAMTGEWKNNFALGGSVEAFEDEKMKDFSEAVAKQMGLDYVGLDIFKVDDGYRVIETNIFACFEGFEIAFPEINVPEHILNCLNK